jgi:DNA-binding MarR family transcriptional regulator
MNSTTSFNHLIDLLLKHFAQIEAQAFHEGDLAELSMRQIVCLEKIERIGHPTFSDLASELKISRPSVTALYQKLSQKGYLTRIQSAEDKRTYYIHLTEKGKSVQRVHNRLHQKIAQHFSRALNSKELETLRELLEKIAKFEE